ncbi:MAG: TatD family hydrolase [Chloroflexota bacterium]
MNKPDLIDTHCHLNFDAYDDDRDAVIQRAVKAGVRRMIIPATDLTTSREAIALAEQYDGIYAAVGIHPNSTADFDESLIDQIAALADHPKVIAIGEIGLDYYWDKSPPEQQQRAFRAQLELATRLELPVIIHNRDAGPDVMGILTPWAPTVAEHMRQRPGVMHSFSAPVEIAERALAAGFYLGFTGPLTFKKAEDLRKIARRVPIHRVLIETDGPFLTPEPYRGRRNEPAYVLHVADRLGSLHRLPLDEIARLTTANAERLFNLPAS